MTDGFLIVDKVSGVTSHDVVARARRRLGTRKVGHAGTLDPDATGVLVLGFGRATRLLRYFTDLDKRYETEIVFGSTTTTLDASGDVTSTFAMGVLDPVDVRRVAGRFEGDIQQVPPMVSAVKIGGRRLHELAREGIEIDRPARPVRVDRFFVEPLDPGSGIWRADVVCSSGTYVRALVADLGTELGGGAHLRALRRTAIGSFTTEHARDIDDALPISIADGLAHLAAVTVTTEIAARVSHGRVLDRRDLPLDGDGPWLLLDAERDALAVYEAHGPERAKPAVVIAPA